MLAMLALAVIDDIPADEVLALADGSRHAPAPLSPDKEKPFAMPAPIYLPIHLCGAPTGFACRTGCWPIWMRHWQKPMLI